MSPITDRGREILYPAEWVCVKLAAAAAAEGFRVLYLPECPKDVVLEISRRADIDRELFEVWVEVGYVLRGGDFMPRFGEGAVEFIKQFHQHIRPELIIVSRLQTFTGTRAKDRSGLFEISKLTETEQIPIFFQVDAKIRFAVVAARADPFHALRDSKWLKENLGRGAALLPISSATYSFFIKQPENDLVHQWGLWDATGSNAPEKYEPQTAQRETLVIRVQHEETSVSSELIDPPRSLSSQLRDANSGIWRLVLFCLLLLVLLLALFAVLGR